MLLLAPDGEVLVRHRSRDFADRPDDSDVLAALRRLELSPVPPPSPWRPQGVTPQPTENAFRPEAFGAYFRGLRFGTLALSKRMRDDEDRAETEAVSQMAVSFLEAWQQRRDT